MSADCGHIYTALLFSPLSCSFGMGNLPSLKLKNSLSLIARSAAKRWRHLYDDVLSCKTLGRFKIAFQAKINKVHKTVILV